MTYEELELIENQTLVKKHYARLDFYDSCRQAVRCKEFAENGQVHWAHCKIPIGFKEVHCRTEHFYVQWSNAGFYIRIKALANV